MQQLDNKPLSPFGRRANERADEKHKHTGQPAYVGWVHMKHCAPVPWILVACDPVADTASRRSHEHPPPLDARSPRGKRPHKGTPGTSYRWIADLTLAPVREAQQKNTSTHLRSWASKVKELGKCGKYGFGFLSAPVAVDRHRNLNCCTVSHVKAGSV